MEIRGPVTGNESLKVTLTVGESGPAWSRSSYSRAIKSFWPLNKSICSEKLPLLHGVEPANTPFLKTSTSKSPEQMPATVIGKELNDWPLLGVLIIGACVGGADGTVACKPADPVRVAAITPAD